MKVRCIRPGTDTGTSGGSESNTDPHTSTRAAARSDTESEIESWGNTADILHRPEADIPNVHYREEIICLTDLSFPEAVDLASDRHLTAAGVITGFQVTGAHRDKATGRRFVGVGTTISVERISYDLKLGALFQIFQADDNPSPLEWC